MNTKKIVGSVASIQTLNAEERKRKSCKRFLAQKYAFNLCNDSDDKVLIIIILIIDIIIISRVYMLFSPIVTYTAI